MQERSVEAIERAVAPAAEADRAGHDCLEDRLHIRRRAADGLQDLARRCLLLAGLGGLRVGFGQRAILLVQECTCFLQALLEFANSRRALCRHLTDERARGFRLHLRRLRTPTHVPLPVSLTQRSTTR